MSNKANFRPCWAENGGWDGKQSQSSRPRLPRRFAPRNDRGGCAAGCAKQSQFAGDGDAPRRRRGRGDECKAIGKKGLGLMLCDSVVNRGRGEIGKLGGRRRAVLRRGISNKANLARPKPGNPKHKARNSRQARKRNAPNAQQSPFRPAGAPNEPNFRFFRPETRVARKNKANLRRSEGRDWGFGIADWRLETGDSRGSRGAVPVCQTKPMSKWVTLATPRGWRITLSQRPEQAPRASCQTKPICRRRGCGWGFRIADWGFGGGGLGCCARECQTKPIWRRQRCPGPLLGGNRGNRGEK